MPLDIPLYRTSHTFSVVSDEAETGRPVAPPGAIVKRWRKPIGEANGTARSRPVKKGGEVTGAKSFVQNPGWGWIRVVNKLYVCDQGSSSFICLQLSVWAELSASDHKLEIHHRS